MHGKLYKISEDDPVKAAAKGSGRGVKAYALPSNSSNCFNVDCVNCTLWIDFILFFLFFLLMPPKIMMFFVHFISKTKRKMERATRFILLLFLQFGSVVHIFLF